MSEEFGFAALVMVRAQAVRVIAEPRGDTHRFRQSLSRSVGAGRFEIVEFDDGEVWPGQPIDESWVDTARGYPVTPTLNGQVLARVRRVEWSSPEVCVVVGHTRRTEGAITPVDGASTLVPPTRTVPLLEIARPPAARGGRARLALVHRNDAYLVEQRVTA